MTPAAPVLLVTHDEALLDDLLRLAAAAGCQLEVAHDVAAGLRGWSAAAVVLVGADLAGGVAEQRPPRREQVHVVSAGPAADGLFRSALDLGATDVTELPAAEAWLVELLTDATDGPRTGSRSGRGALTLGVVAGSGGAGATTFACALALTAATSGRAALLDLDPLGPGVDRVVGLEAGDGVRWDALTDSRGRLGSRSLRAALPGKDGLAVLTWAPGPPLRLDPPLAREVLSASCRGNDVVVLDLPRSVDDVGAEVAARCDLVLVVTDPSVPGVAAAGRVVAGLLAVTERVGLAVRAGAVAPDHVARVLDLPLVCEVGTQRRLAEHLDLGLGPVRSRRSPLARAARTTLTAVA